MAPKVISVIVSLAGVGTVGALAALFWAARQTLAPTYSKRYDIVPLVVTDDEIELPATPRTAAPGIFGLHIAGADEPAIVGHVSTRTNFTVKRRVLHRPMALSSGAECRWSGIVSDTPQLPFSDIKLQTSLGPAPAWMIDNNSDSWAIHVHGQGSDRRQTLRGVPTATKLGLNSLVLSYRNDGEGPPSADGRSHLGESEWHDLEVALGFIAKRGGTRCIIFGWSLGATIALNALQRSRFSHMIGGIVMIAPVLSWEEALRANASHQGWPRAMGSIVTSLVSYGLLSRLTGLSRPLEVRKADAARFDQQLEASILILHNKGDWSVPIDTSNRFIQAHGDQVELVEFDCLGHTQEWNSDPVMWDLAVRRWYGRLFQPDTAEDKAGITADGLWMGLNNGWR